MIDNQFDSGPVIVGVDGSERSVEALALADLLGSALRRRVVIAHVHPYRQLSSLFAEGGVRAARARGCRVDLRADP
jgi:hypothetical protein